MAASPCPAPRGWCRWWAAWLIVFAVTGTVADLVAFSRAGYRATLSAHIRRWAGADPVRYQRVGSAGVIAFLGWALLHLGFGVLNPGGTEERPPRVPPLPPDPFSHY